MAVGQFKKMVAFGAVGGLVGAAVGQALGGKTGEVEAGSMADSFPQLRQAILAVSNQRWLLFEQSAISGNAKSIAAQWPLDAIRSVELEKGKMTHQLCIHFADGSAAQVEAVKAAKPEKLIEAATPS